MQISQPMFNQPPQTQTPTPTINQYQPPQQQTQDQNQDNEILNISKIKEGFYIGDKIAAVSIEVIIQFKISHIINATGTQIMNHFESVGIKYLTLKWFENETQFLFDNKDELPNKIVEFIDTALETGEGILGHSVKGQNRICIVVIIYLMKKYKWSLKKSLEYLKSKKKDVNIVPYFFIQLQNFEQRLIQRGELKQNDIPWDFDNLTDPEEKLLRNTYMNGLPNKINKNDFINKNKMVINNHILWNDHNPNDGKLTIMIGYENDLYLKQNIIPIRTHLLKRPNKPCIKKNKYNNKANNFILNNEGNLNNYINDKNADSNNKNINVINNMRNNNVLVNNQFINQLDNDNKVNNFNKNDTMINKKLNEISNFLINKNNMNNNNNNIPMDNINIMNNNQNNNQENNNREYNLIISGQLNNLLNNKTPTQKTQKIDLGQENKLNNTPNAKNNNSQNLYRLSLNNNPPNNNNNPAIFSNNVYTNINNYNNNNLIANNNNNFNINDFGKLPPKLGMKNYNNQNNEITNKENINQITNKNMNKIIGQNTTNNNNIFISNPNYGKQNMINLPNRMNQFSTNNNNNNNSNLLHLRRPTPNATNNNRLNAHNMNNIYNSNNYNIKNSNINNYINYNPIGVYEKNNNNNSPSKNKENNNIRQYNIPNSIPIRRSGVKNNIPYNNPKNNTERHTNPNSGKIPYNPNDLKKPLNNFNPNLIRRKGTPQSTSNNQYLNRNQINGPVRIQNNNYLIDKKPNTPDLTHYSSSAGFKINDKNKNTNNNFNNNFISNSKGMNFNNFNNKYAIMNNNNPSKSNGFEYNNKNKQLIPRPSTAPHKDKTDNNNKPSNANCNVNYYYNGTKNDNIVNNLMMNKLNQRPMSAGKEDNDNNNNNLDNRYILNKNANINISNMGLGKRLPSPKINSNLENNMMDNKIKRSYNRGNGFGGNNHNLLKPKNMKNKRPPLPNSGNIMIPRNSNY